LEKCPHFLWLDYGALARRIACGTHNSLGATVYFTAYATWKPGEAALHKEYVKVLRSSGVEAVHGRFMRSQIRCPLCKKSYWKHFEKRTDVNIALRILCDAIRDVFDRAVILSADSDLLPVIDAVHEIAPGKEIGVMVPIGRESQALKQQADFRLHMRERLLRECQFPDEVNVDGMVIRRPPHWPPVPEPA
jgi:uncharacterized LabA/DUF88 family protein